MCLKKCLQEKGKCFNTYSLAHYTFFCMILWYQMCHLQMTQQPECVGDDEVPISYFWQLDGAVTSSQVRIMCSTRVPMLVRSFQHTMEIYTLDSCKMLKWLTQNLSLFLLRVGFTYFSKLYQFHHFCIRKCFWSEHSHLVWGESFHHWGGLKSEESFVNITTISHLHQPKGSWWSSGYGDAPAIRRL